MDNQYTLNDSGEKEMFLMRPTGAYSSKLLSAGKQRNARRGQQASPIACESPAVNKVLTMAAIDSKVP